MTWLKALVILAVLAPAGAVAATPEANERIAARVFLEKMGQGRFDKLDEIYAPGFVARSPDGRTYTLDEDNASGKEWRRSAPDLKVTILRMASSKDMVAVHFRATGTNTVAAAGMPGVGHKVAIEGMTFFRFVDGRIAEEWSLMDMAGLQRQLSKPVAP